MNLDSFLISLHLLVEDWWKTARPFAPRKAGRPASLPESAVLPLTTSPNGFASAPSGTSLESEPAQPKDAYFGT
jgi:hypothetical protein